MKKLLYLTFILIACNPKIGEREIVVGIKALGTVPEHLKQEVTEVIDSVYGFRTVVLPDTALPSSAFINVKSPRYRADKLIQFLKGIKPDSIDLIIGITQKDISITKRDKIGNIKKPESKYRDWGIFGLGYRPGPSSVVSIYRLRSKGEEIRKQRFAKICMHEIGHNLGLKHCTNSDDCVMRSAAESIRTVDHVQLKLCESCYNKIH